MDALVCDVRHALRGLARSPGFALTAALTLALGIGANAAMFSVASAVLLRPLPFAEPEGLLMVRETSPRTGTAGIHLTPASFSLLQREASAFEALEAYRPGGVNLGGGDDPERVEAAYVSAGLLATLGVNAAAGRLFREDEDQPGRDHVVVLSDRLGTRRFEPGRSPVGQTLLVDGAPHTVIGVMPPGFQFPIQADPVDLWLPIPHEELAAHAGARFLRVIGRLEPGVTPAQAGAQLELLAQRLRALDPRNNEGLGLIVFPLRERVVGGVRTSLLVLLGAVGALLAIACVNVASLLLARAARRQREIAIRTALGASRLRLARQFLTEGLLLSALGGGLGWLAASWTLGILVAYAPADLPRPHPIALDSRAFAFTLVACAVSGVLVALAPAGLASRLAPQAALRDAAGSTVLSASRGVRGALVLSEMALALPLVIAAGLLLRSFLALRAVDTGFRAEGVLTAQLELPPARYASPESIVAMHRLVVERIGELPDVRAVGGSTHFLFQRRWRNPVGFEGSTASPGELPLATVSPVTPGYFAALGVVLRSGRLPDARDDASAPPIAVIDATAARRFFEDREPLGRRLKLGDPSGPDPWMTVVGVVDAALEAPDGETLPEVYLPLDQVPRRLVPLVARTLTVCVRTGGDPLSLAPAVRAAVQAIDREQPVFKLATLRQLVGESRAQRSFQLGLVGLFAALALVLACIGLYGLVSYQTAQRTREIGLRMALGARRLDVFRLVLGQGLKLALAGSALGLLGALALTRALGALLFGVGPADPPTFVGAALVLAGAALAAVFLPARRAAGLDPTLALRHE